MRLKELTVQGYKSFATKHRFVFPSAVTAVIGPNGSGKSNIADAIRWVLGEQRASHLRAKRTHDLIFAGTERRPRAGLAQVSLTVDNEDGWLDIDFPEVVITRRAHRDGTNEYLINDSRVRLRDVLDLLEGQLGKSNYTVIGQGLVDSALSLRPEERRGLIDEAAGVVPLQRKRDGALRRLAETDENLTRVRDIMAEIGPGLRRMARLADRADRHEQLARELETHLADWYGYRWHRASEQLAAARSKAEELEAAIQGAREAVDDVDKARERAQRSTEAAEADLERHRLERERLATEAAAAHQAAAVASARLEARQSHRVEVDSDRATLDHERKLLARRTAGLEAEIATLEEVRVTRQNAVAGAREALTTADSRYAVCLESIEETRSALFDLSSKLAARRNELNKLTETARARELEREEVARERDATAELLHRLEFEVSEREMALTAADQGLAAATEEAAAAEEAVAPVAAELDQARQRGVRAQSHLESLRERESALEALQTETDAVGRLIGEMEQAGEIGFVGRVSSLLTIEPGWEMAVSSALGSRCDGIVVHDSSSADRALARMPSDARSRLTIVPLTGKQRPGHAWVPIEGELPADAVARAPQAAAIVHLLLGSTAFVEDLGRARTAVSRTDGPARAATRDGNLILPGGVIVTGPAARGALVAQHELDAVRSELETAAGDEARLAERTTALEADRRSLESRVAALSQRRAHAREARAAAKTALEDARLRLERSRREHEWATGALARADDELAALERERTALQEKTSSAALEEQSLSPRIKELEAEREAADPMAARAALNEAIAAAAETAQSLAARKAQHEAAIADGLALEERMVRIRTRLAETAADTDELHAEASRLAEDAQSRQLALEALDERAAPTEAEVLHARQNMQDLAKRLNEQRLHLSELQTQLIEARLSATRHEDGLNRLYDQLRADGEWLPSIGVLPQQLTLGGAAGVPLPIVTALPRDLEQRISAQRRELRSIGAIDREALAEYRDTAARHDLLTEQKADLEVAARDLRTALETLESEIQSRFEATFETVAEAFAAFFPQLFGGGEAQLVVADEPVGSPGIEIVARPPGKHSQPLSLLSGGERAITAVALIFALLKVSETPFVVLDEVDAALDEANVDRFCAALEALSATTQVVIITHNRGTIQRAGVVYGITMGDDGASQVISLRVEEAA